MQENAYPLTDMTARTGQPSTLNERCQGGRVVVGAKMYFEI
jgi:hypothetical protein